MSKPLELKTYPTAASRGYVAEGPGVFIRRDERGRRIGSIPVGNTHKRLTDAELAAEYHSADATVWIIQSASHATGEWDEGLVEATVQFRRTLERFATHPHYDEQ